MRALLLMVCILALAGCSDGGRSATNAVEETPNGLSRTGGCSTHTFQVAFAPDAVVIASDGKEIAHATDGNRDMTPVCRAAQPPREAVDTKLNDGVGGEVDLDCDAGRPISVNVHPIQKGKGEPILGSNLVVYTQPPGFPVQLVVLAVLKKDAPAETKLYYDPAACS